MMGGRRLSDLRVLELRQELEKRGLDKSGIKAVLVERLTAVLEKEGVDVENYLADRADSTGTSSAKGEGEETSETGAVTGQVLSEEGKVVEPTETKSNVEERTGGALVEVFEMSGTPSNDEVVEEKDKPTLTSEAAVVKVEEPPEVDLEEAKKDETKMVVVEEIATVGAAAAESGTKEVAAQSKATEIPAVKDDVMEAMDTCNVTEGGGVSTTIITTAGVDEGTATAEGDAGATEDDHDELHITIGEEEDKFMMDDVEDSISVEVKVGEGNKKAATAVKEEKKSEADKELCDSTGIHVDSTDNKSEASTSEVLSTSNQAKSIDKSIEGRARRKSKDEDRDTLLVTGLSAETAATDLKNLFKKYGKIGGVKIMLSAKDPGASRFALVAVLASEDVETCIQKLDGHELHGRIIHVQKAGTDMLSADWSRKEGNRESGTKRSSSEASKPKSNAKSNSEDEKAKRVKKGSEAGTTPIKTESRRKSASEKSSASKDKKPSSSSEDKKKSDSTKAPREKERKEGSGRGRGDFRPFRGRGMRGFRDLPHHTQGGLRVRPRVPIPNRREYGQMSGRRDFQRRHAFHDRESRDLVARSPPRYRRQEPEPPRRGGRPELTFEDIYDIRQREKVREMEREKREIERRRLEEEEKQQQLDLEIRQLAKQREKIEQEKLELKRQKERMIMEEREKQKLERERIQREKDELARRLEETRRLASSSKRTEIEYDMSADRKKVADALGRHSGYPERSYSREKDKLRPEPYRRPEPSRYGQINEERSSHVDSPGRSVSVRNAPERDPRTSVWAKERVKSRERSPERSTHHQRDREPIDASRLDDRKSKLYTQVVQLSGSTQPRYPGDASSSHFNIPSSSWTREVETKAVDSYSANLRDNRWTQRTIPTYNADVHTSTPLSSVRAESWTSRESAWMPPERTTTRPIVDIPERWVSGSGAALNGAGRTSLPVAPPPPIYSATAGNPLSMSGHGGGIPASYLGSPYNFTHYQ